MSQPQPIPPLDLSSEKLEPQASPPASPRSYFLKSVSHGQLHESPLRKSQTSTEKLNESPIRASTIGGTGPSMLEIEKQPNER